MTQAIKFNNVTYTYGRNTPFFRVALDNVSLSVEAGVITGIIGHTGSGKSTLVQHINGLLEPDSGQIIVMDRDIWEDKKRLREVRYLAGLVFQYPEYQLFDETVAKDVAFGPKNMGLEKDEIDQRVRDAVRFVGLPENVLEKSPFELSGGQKRRVAIAGVIAMRPQILILDEPAAGLDPRGREEILGVIRA
ncbi:MAG: ATP-binding cassette domain-containing protein, partial [Oscillospiraceae bacterium]|nr:ATP-binding cassette domain-containing protein [Oscillospiraceae bacterium]